MPDDRGGQYSGLSGTARLLFKSAKRAISGDGGSKPKDKASQEDRDPNTAPVGSGIANQGRRTIRNRRNQIDSAVEQQSGLSLSDARRRPKY